MMNKNTFRSFLGCLLMIITVSCNYTIKVKDGNTAWQVKRYHQAIPFLQKTYNKSGSRAEKGLLAFRIAESYRLTGNNQQALQWYKNAYDNNYGAEALRGYAYGLKQAENYAQALTEFQQLGIEIGSPYEYRKEVTACKIATDWKQQAPFSPYQIAPAPFNSPQNDFSPVFAPDKRLVFTSDRSTATGKEPYRWTGNRYMDLFVVDPSEASAQNYDLMLNTASNEGAAYFSPKGDELYLVKTIGAYKEDDQFCKIYVAYTDNNTGWNTPVPLPYQKDRINYVHPCLSADGNTLYFSCNDPEGWGGFDLYSMSRSPTNETGWSPPKLLSRNLNTAGNEVFPTFDGDTLYFASDGLPGMGGLDIFMTYKMDKSNWAPPLNLKSPANSGADDFGWIITPSSINKNASKTNDIVRTGFFTSNRNHDGARGMDDIYQFTQIVPPKPPVVQIDTISKDIPGQIIIEGYVVEKIFTITDDPNSKVLGRKPLAEATVTVEGISPAVTIKTAADGYFKIVAKPQTDYRFMGKKGGYLNNTTAFSTKGIGKDPKNPIQVFEIEIVLDKIYRDKEIVLENIYYDYEKWDIRPDAEPTLNSLANILTQNPEIRIVLASHTDCRGNDAYNQALSQRRAESAVQYLSSKGIQPDRMRAAGYGESTPAAPCACNKCSETEHQVNRRTTFKIE